MRNLLGATTIAFAFGLIGFAAGQQGDQGRNMREMDNSVQGIERSISRYLNGPQIKSVLTPGEFNEWALKLKAGQVVIAEASSDAFDPALEIADQKGTVLTKNDDRYPGDQRPLLLWRCPQDGDYSLHVRCFHDKSGGAFFVRFKTYDSVDLSSGQMVEQDVDGHAPFLLRVPMKAGQIKTIQADVGGDHKYMGITFEEVISPAGLPEQAPSLGARLNPNIRALVAPLDGDYYLLYAPAPTDQARGKIHVGTREIVPTTLVKQGNTFSATGPTNSPVIWEINVKAGEFFRATTPELNIDCQLTLASAPDFSKFDATKPDENPFYPHKDVNEDPAFDTLSAREGDSRITVFRARKDAKLWLSSNCAGPDHKVFALTIGPGTFDLSDSKPNTGTLRIADTDYWTFDAKAGDVMALSATAAKFAEMVIVRDSDLSEVRHGDVALDQTTDKWQMIVQKPGRYLLSVSCHGNGGSGDYSLSRKVFHAKEFGRSGPATGEIADGQIQIWTFQATPKKPLLIHWNSSKWDYDVSIYNEKGESSDFERQEVDAQNQFGILKVDKPQTFVIVLTGHGAKASYSIDLGDIPGYKAAK